MPLQKITEQQKQLSAISLNISNAFVENTEHEYNLMKKQLSAITLITLGASAGKYYIAT